MIKLDGKPINVTRFPDNSCQVWKLDEALLKEGINAVITWDYQHDYEFMEVAQLKTLLDSMGKPTRLRLDYLPYGRQDKAISNTTTFGLATFAALLNSLNFVNVICLDPHSDAAKLRINNFMFWYPEAEWNDRLKPKTLVCFPDRGAREKYREYFGSNETIYAEKCRDPLIGEVSWLELHGDPKGRDVLIIDDICDGGATFIAVTKALKEKGAKSVELFVSHGIFSKGTRVLFEAGISRIFTPKGEVGPRFGDQQ